MTTVTTTTATVKNQRTLAQLDAIGNVWGGMKRTEVIDRLAEREYTRMKDSGALDAEDASRGDSTCASCAGDAGRSVAERDDAATPCGAENQHSNGDK